MKKVLITKTTQVSIDKETLVEILKLQEVMDILGLEYAPNAEPSLEIKGDQAPYDGYPSEDGNIRITWKE
jgi:hypothetical protein